MGGGGQPPPFFMSSKTDVNELGISNMALGFVGSSRIQSLTDSSPAARECRARVYDSINFVLRLHPWEYCAAHERLATPSATPAFGFSYVFTLPGDCLKFWGLYDEIGERVDNYRSISGNIHTDTTPVFAAYSVKKEVSDMPPELAMVVAYHLAHVIAPVLSQSGDRVSERLFQAYRVALSEARFLSATNRGPLVQGNTNWNDSRNQTVGAYVKPNV